MTEDSGNVDAVASASVEGMHLTLPEQRPSLSCLCTWAISIALPQLLCLARTPAFPWGLSSCGKQFFSNSCLSSCECAFSEQASTHSQNAPCPDRSTRSKLIASLHCGLGEPLDVDVQPQLITLSLAASRILKQCSTGVLA